MNMEQDLSYFADFGEQIEQRVAKLKNFSENNQLAYPPRIKRDHTTVEAIALFEQAQAVLPADSEETPQVEVAIAGRLVSVRVMGKSAFAHLEDGAGRLQIYLRKNDLGDAYDTFKQNYDIGDFVAAQGTLFKTRTGEVTLNVGTFQMASKALHPPRKNGTVSPTLKFATVDATWI
jgi:lysyl-tRNA synthetase class 2